jgi:metal-responsive CopG/Arc/MetJ family transcriptional regulator
MSADTDHRRLNVWVPADLLASLDRAASAARISRAAAVRVYLSAALGDPDTSSAPGRSGWAR